jgi:cell division protein FtsW
LTAATVSPRPSAAHPAEDAERRLRPRSPRRSRSARLKDRLPLPFHLVWVVTLILLIIGLCMLLSESTGVTSEDKFGYLRNQGITAAVGLALLLLVSRADYEKLRAWSVAFLGVVVLSLFVVHVPGVARVEGGAGSYIPLGPFTYQPSEFAKLAVVLFGAHFLTSPRVAGGRFWSYMWPFGLGGALMCLLVMWEHDLGTAIIIAGLLLGMLWMGGMKGIHLGLIGSAGMAGAVGFTLMSSERMSRILAWINPSAYPDDSWQLRQALIGLGRGGWFGVGPGQSIQKYQWLPKARSDMIFGIIGEEFGLAGAAVLIFLFIALALVCWRLARRCDEPMGKLLIAGCGMLVTLEAIVNIGGVTGALPLTGIPLPFISYGRNSLLVMLVAVGLILAVCRRAPDVEARSEGERFDNVTHLDSRRWDGRARGARAGAR